MPRGIRWIEPGEWRYLIVVQMVEEYRNELKGKMVRDICTRCAPKEEKAKRKKEIKALDQFRRDETDKITQKIMDDLKRRFGVGTKSNVIARERGTLAFKDEALRDEIIDALSAPKGWAFWKSECGGGIAF